MLKIAIVDDEYAVVEELYDKLADYSFDEGVEFSVEKFTSGKDFLERGANEFDILLLDIDMPGLNGIQTAKKLREKNDNLIIIFCTNLVQYAINGYEVSALGYLVKPVKDYPLRLNLDKACRLLGRRQKQRVVLKTVHSHEVVDISDILFVEVQRHNIFFNVLRNGKIEKIRTRGSMQEIADKLNSTCFARCNTCYLVNLDKVLAIENNTVKLPDVKLPISRSFQKDFPEAFMKFLVESE